MLYGPSAITAAELEIAQAPYLGGEYSVFLTTEPAILLGEVDMTASGTGAYTPQNGAAITPEPGKPGSVNAVDLQLVATTAILSGTTVVVTFNVLDQSNVARTATATFVAPSRVANQSPNFQRGVAADLVLSGGTQISSIVGLASIVGGGNGMSFRLYQLPEAADYTLVGCTTTKKFNTKSRQAIGIDCQMEADAFVKLGKTKKGELTVDAKFRSMKENLVRFDGIKSTAMLVGLKEQQVTNDRLVFVQFVPSVEVDLPDGDGESMENAATGKFVDHLFFTAPGP